MADLIELRTKQSGALLTMEQDANEAAYRLLAELLKANPVD
jgi:hypothetical protein